MALQLFFNHTVMTTRLCRLEFQKISLSLEEVMAGKEMLDSFTATEAEQNFL